MGCEKCIDDGFFPLISWQPWCLTQRFVTYRLELVLLADSKTPDEKSGDFHYLLNDVVVITALPPSSFPDCSFWKPSASKLLWHYGHERVFECIHSVQIRHTNGIISNVCIWKQYFIHPESCSELVWSIKSIHSLTLTCMKMIIFN